MLRTLMMIGGIILFGLLCSFLLSPLQWILDSLSTQISEKTSPANPSFIPVYNSTNSPSLQRGTYNLSNNTIPEDILDPTKWYVENSSLSMEYVLQVYNDTLKVVENATETSQSIIERFFRIFGKSNTTSSIKSKILEIFEVAKGIFANLTSNKP